MFNPIEIPLKAFQAAVTGAAYLVGLTTTAMLRMMQNEYALVGFPYHRRAEELHTHTNVAPTGVAWTDHYGKRTHDVDVEHMR